MSYKKIEDINYLYENIDQSIPKEVEDCVSLIVEELSSRGYSESAINCFIETSDEVTISELLNEKVKVSGDVLKQGPKIIQALKTFFKNRQFGNVLNKSKNVIKNNPVKSAAAVTGGSVVGSAALSDKDEKKNGNNNQGGSTFRAPGIDKAERVRTGGNNNTSNNTSNNTTDSNTNNPNLTVQDKKDAQKEKDLIQIQKDKESGKFKEIEAKAEKEAERKRISDASAEEKKDTDADPVDGPKMSTGDRIKMAQANAKKVSPASFNTNQRQTRDLVKQQTKAVYPSIEKSDLNQFNRSKKYTAADGKTQVDRSTVFTKAKFDFGNIKKGQELGVLTKGQRKQYDLKAAGMKEDYDAFDIVLGYLTESGQVDTVDEALYIMMEMDAATIQSIVKDFEMLTEEEADRMKDERLEKYGIGHDGSDRKAGSGGRSNSKKPKGKTNLQKEDEKKYGKGKSAVDIVRAKIEKKHGKGAIA